MASTLLRYKLVFFCPRNSTQTVPSALFNPTLLNDTIRANGSVGKIGAYDGCAFVSPGIGQFRPVDGANPTIGAVGKEEQVEEDRVETQVLGTVEYMKGVVEVLKKHHPYEEVAFDVYKLEDF